MNVTDWLCDPDTAIRWQTLCDLAGASPTRVNAERARVANAGIAAEILAQQQPDGAWRRAYNEAFTVSTGEAEGQPSRWNTLRALRPLRWLAEAPRG
jgi:hypothetical protein